MSAAPPPYPEYIEIDEQGRIIIPDGTPDPIRKENEKWLKAYQSYPGDNLITD